MATTKCVPELPTEMIFKILILLPVLSLLQCRSVCKLWASIISSSKFVEAHLTKSKEKLQSLPSAVLVDAEKEMDRSLEQSLPSFVLVDADEQRDRSLYLLDSNEDIHKFHLPSIFEGMNWCIGSCDGLVTISGYPLANVIYLCNPLTQRSRILPTPKIQSVRHLGINLGFGFDPISKDYKILRTMKRSYNNGGTALEAEVYSANADSWKEIQVPKILQSITFTPTNCVHARTGVLYLEGRHLHLLSFDLHNEMFRVYPYPNRERYNIASNVINFEGSVGMFFESVVDRPTISLWILDDACGKVSWTKKFKIEPDMEINRVCLYSSVGQFVAQDYLYRYILYDSRKKQTKKFPHSASFTQVNGVIKYTESLVWLKRFETLD